jgi:shikimate kinase
MERLIAERYPTYAKADVTVSTRDERKEVIATEVIDALAIALGDGAAGTEKDAQ